jgi:putative component of toxin-antitoxin plasmid stabilization module
MFRNEFEVKYRVYLNKHQRISFLLVFTGDKAANEDNWLLDIELAHHVFRTDQEVMFLQEMG